MKLIEYRDAGMHTYTYFYASEDRKGVLSPYFNTQKEAEDWLKEQVNKFDNWKASRDIA